MFLKWPYVLALTAGLVLPLAFAPFHSGVLAVIAPALWTTCWQGSPKQAAITGLLFGMGFFGVGISWIDISIQNYGQLSPPSALLLTSMLVLVLASLHALQAYGVRLCMIQYPLHTRKWVCLILFPLSWLGVEGIRHAMGFPWMLLGYSQTQGSFSGYAPLIGVYGLSTLCALSSALLACHHRITYGILMALGLLGMALSSISWSHPYQKSFSVALVQGNVPETLKWDPRYHAAIVRHYAQLTGPYWDSDLIIWPESALTADPKKLATALQHLSQPLALHPTTVLAGAPLLDPHGHVYNGLISLGPKTQYIKKRRLVPFGEYLPFKRLLTPLMRSLQIPTAEITPGPEQQAPIWVQHHPIAGFICYDIAYPGLVAKDAYASHLLVLITDDAWFGHGFAAAQHQQMAQMRALENARTLLISSNNGRTAIIDQHGHIVKELAPYRAGVLTEPSVPLLEGTTPFMHFFHQTP